MKQKKFNQNKNKTVNKMKGWGFPLEKKRNSIIAICCLNSKKLLLQKIQFQLSVIYNKESGVLVFFEKIIIQ